MKNVTGETERAASLQGSYFIFFLLSQTYNGNSLVQKGVILEINPPLNILRKTIHLDI